MQNISFLLELQRLIQSRRLELPSRSYTATLFQCGLDKIAQKVGEESTEVIIAAMAQEKSQLVYESADLIFHLIVLLVEKEICLSEIILELQKRYQK